MLELSHLWLTIAMLFAGLVTHFLKKLMEASADNKPIGFFHYWKSNPYRSLMSIMGAVIGYVLALKAGELSEVTAFLIGFSANSAADLVAKYSSPSSKRRMNSPAIMSVFALLLVFAGSGCAGVASQHAESPREHLYAASSEIAAIAKSVANSQSNGAITAEQAESAKSGLKRAQYLVDFGMLVSAGDENEVAAAKLTQRMQANGEMPQFITLIIHEVYNLAPKDRPVQAMDVLVIVNQLLLLIQTDMKGPV